MGDRATRRRRGARLLLLALLAGVVVLALGVAATQALAFSTFTQSQGAISSCGTCHTLAGTHPPAIAAHTGIACGTCHTNGTAEPPTPAACASCHGAAAILAGATHTTIGCGSTPGCHGVPAVDTTPPVTTLTGAVNNRCYNRTLNMTLTATDAGGVASITYAIDGGTPVVVMGDMADVTLTVDRTGHTTDGTHVITYFATDVADNVEATQTLRVRIDTVRPRTRALRVARAHRYEFTNLRYRINDSSPSCGRANVTIRIRRGAKLVRTLRLGVKPVNRTLQARVRANMASGRYRYYVYASDLAGNGQTNVASNWLIIRPAFGGGSW